MLKKREKKLTVVIGASRLGAVIANHNAKNGVYTIIVDKNPLAFRKLDSNYAGVKIEGNAEELDTLEKASIKEATEVNILTNYDNTNIYIANVILKYYNVPNIVVRLMDTTKSALLDSSRIKIISPSILSFDKYNEIINSLKEEK